MPKFVPVGLVVVAVCLSVGMPGPAFAWCDGAYWAASPAERFAYSPWGYRCPYPGWGWRGWGYRNWGWARGGKHWRGEKRNSARQRW